MLDLPESACLVASLVECPVTKTLEVVAAASHIHGLVVLVLAPTDRDHETGSEQPLCYLQTPVTTGVASPL